MSHYERFLSEFTADDYKRYDGEGSVDYIEAILISRDITFEKSVIEKMITQKHTSFMTRFFENSGYGPDTKLAQLVQLTVCAEKQSFDSHKLRINPPLQKAINRTITYINEAREIISQEIFGSQAPGYRIKIKSHVNECLKPGNEGGRTSILKRRSNELVDDIKTNFPLTSR